jgi:hypothetical protein
MVVVVEGTDPVTVVEVLAGGSSTCEVGGPKSNNVAKNRFYV